jgi:hypothetical protein
MKHFLLPLTLILSVLSIAQPDPEALENLIIETYYVSGEGDAPNPPEGSVTYRIYADLKPGYKLQIVNSDQFHPIQISTNSEFFNSQFGATFGSEFLGALLNFNAAILDSYVTLGPAAQGYFGIEKTVDPDASSLLGTSPPYLQNDDPLAGIPLTQSDGLIATETASVSSLGLDNGELSASFGLNNSSTPFETANGAWFNLQGVEGPTEENHVLIGQFTTTDGSLDFCLNLEVLIPEELWVDSRNKIFFVGESHPNDEEINSDVSSNIIIYQKDYLCADIDPLSTEDTDGFENLSLFPNPTQDWFQFRADRSLTNASAGIFDMSGRLVKQKTFGNTAVSQLERIDISNLASGIYMFVLNTDEGNFQGRIIKE